MFTLNNIEEMIKIFSLACAGPKEGQAKLEAIWHGLLFSFGLDPILFFLLKRHQDNTISTTLEWILCLVGLGIFLLFAKDSLFQILSKLIERLSRSGAANKYGLALALGVLALITIIDLLVRFAHLGLPILIVGLVLSIRGYPALRKMMHERLEYLEHLKTNPKEHEALLIKQIFLFNLTPLVLCRSFSLLVLYAALVTNVSATNFMVSLASSVILLLIFKPQGQELTVCCAACARPTFKSFMLRTLCAGCLSAKHNFTE